MGVSQVLISPHFDDAESGEVPVAVDGRRPPVTGLVSDDDGYVGSEHVSGIEAINRYITGLRHVPGPRRVPGTPGDTPLVKAGGGRVRGHHSRTGK